MRIERPPREERKDEKWILASDIKAALKKLPSPLRDQVMADIDHIWVGSVISLEEQEENEKAYNLYFDDLKESVGVFLEEVMWRVVGFRLDELKPHETAEIIRIKQELDLS